MLLEEPTWFLHVQWTIKVWCRLRMKQGFRTETAFLQTIFKEFNVGETLKKIRKILQQYYFFLSVQPEWNLYFYSCMRDKVCSNKVHI